MEKMKSIIVTALGLALFSLVPALSGEGHGGAENPLLTEMMMLDTAFREVVSAVAVGDTGRVRKALEPLHGTMEKTHEGVHSGTVRLHRNEDLMEEFVRMDREFHGHLEELAHAAEEGENGRMLGITQKLLEGCVRCHGTFR